MSKSEIVVVAILSPKEDKIQQLQEVLQHLSSQVHAKEPNTHQYRVLREESAIPPKIVILEKYASKDAQEHHLQAEYTKELFRALEEDELLTEEMQVIVTEPAGGF